MMLTKNVEFFFYAKTKNVNTLVVQQGLVRQDYPEWKYFSGTKLASMGKYSKDIIIVKVC